MNIAYPPTSFDSDEDAINGFITLLQEGYENPEKITATVKLIVSDRPQLNFIARYGETLTIEQHDLERETDTQVEMPIETIHRIFREFEFLDWRDPSIIGTVKFSGNLNYANHLGKSCIRPSNWTMARFRKAGRLHAQKDYKNLTEIEYLHQPTQRQVLKAMEESRPVIVTGLEPTPPCKDWNIEKLAEQYGEAVVRVRSAAHRQTMSEFVEELKQFEKNGAPENIVEGFTKPYTEGAALPEEMWADFGPLFFDAEDFVPPQLWLGSVPTTIPTSSLHRDPLTGFLFQVIGQKRLDLYSADQADLIYPMKAYNLYQPCWFKPEKPDFEVYPKAKAAKCISVTLNPGELIIQPYGWFHQVYALDSPNMSVSYFWRY